MFLSAVLVTVILAAIVLHAGITDRSALPFASTLKLVDGIETVYADGTRPYASCLPMRCNQIREKTELKANDKESHLLWCGPKPCRGLTERVPDQTLADGTNPYPLCMPNPCPPLIVPKPVAGHQSGRQRSISVD